MDGRPSRLISVRGSLGSGLGGSAFNIKSESRLGDFSEQGIGALLAQHTAATGQAFTAEAQALIRTRTAGQPWLANALCYDACFRARMQQLGRQLERYRDSISGSHAWAGPR